MLSPRAEGLAVLLTMISLIGCIEKYDYNVVVGVGLIYLGSKHDYLFNLKSFYVMIIFTIVVDIIQIIVLSNQLIFMRYIVTILQIVVKLLIIVVMILKSNQMKEKMLNNNKQQIRK